MGLRRRLLLSFLALFAVVWAVSAAVSTLLVARAVERRLAEQTENLARLFARNPGFAEGVLRYVEQAYGARSASLEPEGAGPAGEGTFRAPAGPGRELVMVWSPEVLAAEKRRAVLPFAAVAVAGLALAAAAAALTARAVARPIEDLARQARSLPSGEVHAGGGGPEIDHLVQALNRMLEEVRLTERLGVMGKMAVGIAHEIRNPLSSIKLTVQLLREAAADREPYDRLLREIERLELTAAELVGASQPLRKESARLQGVVDEVLELVGRRLDHLGVKVEKRYGEAPPVAVDVARFKSCVMNLVLNGAQAMPAGGPLRVEVAARDGRVRLSVADEGTGVDPGLGDRVFEPFVTTKKDGVGLGLALTRRIVEEHGGAIGYDRASKGTVFWIELPHG